MQPFGGVEMNKVLFESVSLAMTSSVVALGLLFGLSVSAVAAPKHKPLPPPPAPPPVFSWTGFYVGGNAGWAGLNDSSDRFCIAPGGALNGTGCDLISSAKINAGGFIGGAQGGYNWQFGQVVYGIETDFQGTSINGSANFAGTFSKVGGGSSGPLTFTANEKMPWIGTTRGRVGITWDRALLYATGGVAYGEAKVSMDQIYPTNHYPSSASNVRAGWIAGGGVEWALIGNWSGKVEGLYYDLGSVTTMGPSVPFSTGFLAGKTFDVKGAIVRVGFNYKVN